MKHRIVGKTLAVMLSVAMAVTSVDMSVFAEEVVCEDATTTMETEVEESSEEVESIDTDLEQLTASEDIIQEDYADETSAIFDDEIPSNGAGISGISNPRIVADSSMKAGQRVTYDCIWFGSYPQTELVLAGSAEETALVNMNKNFKTEYVSLSSSEFSKLSSASYDLNGDATVTLGGGTIKVRRMKNADAVYASNSYSGKASNFYQWSDTDTYHYFCYNPIKWRVLSVDDNNVFALADIAIDDKWDDTGKDNPIYTDTDSSITWEESTIRNWLNNSFYNLAFSSSEKTTIKTTNVKNDDNIEYGTEGGNDTNDKVFLLSESEVYNTYKATLYGFVKSEGVCDEARRIGTSTYAFAEGVYRDTDTDYIGKSWWWLRSPGRGNNYSVRVEYSGYVSSINSLNSSVDTFGICPALNLNLSSLSDANYAGTVCTDGTVNETTKPGNNGVTYIKDNTIKNIYPIIGATDVNTKDNVTLTFMSDIELFGDISDLGIELREYDTDTPVKTSLQISGKQLVIKLVDGHLKDMTKYYVYIPKDKIKANTKELGIEANKAFYFFTGKTIVNESKIPTNPRVVADSSMDAGQKVTYDCIWFGSYPQTEIVLSDITAKRAFMYVDSKIKVECVPLKASDFSKLSAATFDSNGDATITFSGGRAKVRRMKRSDAVYSLKHAQGYYDLWEDSDTYHYFLYEPIKWRVLSVNGDNILVMSNFALDDQKYNDSAKSITWEESTIRNWLNDSFYNSAFSSGEMTAIKTTNVKNDDNIEYGTEGGNDTNDKVFLLSESEVHTTDKASSYGFVKDNTSDEARSVGASTYALARGTGLSVSDREECCTWWLRSPGCDNKHAMDVGSSGYISEYGAPVDRSYSNATKPDYGVCPAMNLKLSSLSDASYAGTVCTDGTVNETAKPGDGEETVISYEISLNNTDISCKVGDEIQLSAKVVDSNGIIIKNPEITWTSSNEGIVQVVAGKIVAKSVGVAKVTATYMGKTGECKVTVQKNTSKDPDDEKDDENDGMIIQNLGSTGYKLAYTKSVGYNTRSHYQIGAKVNATKVADLVVKVYDPQGNIVDPARYTVKFKNNKDTVARSGKSPSISVALKGKTWNVATKKAFSNIAKVYYSFEIKPMDISTTNAMVKSVKCSNKGVWKINGFCFCNSVGKKINLKAANSKGVGDYKIVEVTDKYIVIDGIKNYSGRLWISKKDCSVHKSADK